MSRTIARQRPIVRLNVSASLVEYFMKESAVSSIMRVSSSELPSSKTIELCRFGLIQTSAVLREIEVPQRGHVVHHHVVDGVHVGVVAGEEDLFGRQPAADFVAALDERHAEARFRQVGRGDQAVRSGADDDDVPVALRRKLLEEALGVLAVL